MSWFKRDKPDDKKPKAIEESRSTCKTEGLWQKCDGCRQIVWKKDLEANWNVCPKCGAHSRMDALMRLRMLLDDGVYETFDDNLRSADPRSSIDQRVFRQRGEINAGVVVARNQFNGLFKRGHHAKAEQINFDEAEIGAVFLVPLNDGAALHRCALDRHDAIEHSRADHHAAGVLAKMARQTLHALAEAEVMRDARMIQVEASLRESALHRVVFAAPLPVPHQAAEALDLLFFKAQRLAHFARSRAATIGDDVGGHRRAQRSIAFVEILNNALTLVARGKIEIDVGPLVAALVEKSLEQKLHADRIDGSQFKCIADYRVRCGPASLHKKPLPLTVADDVPNDEKVACKTELGNQRQFTLRLRARLLQQMTFQRNLITLANAFIDALSKKAVHGSPSGTG